ncbi:AAA family ATPase [Mucilaginibacter pedocola]|uniref:LuxR family transcriptional regulator n=1 Tax=Mucilaginibacter pedocola TaxID=1792845 RepID=A0A1S9PDR8_9SPHI|nr:AAA family ATPase [Mucilaginibacter pedocola]OOQ59114.1 LuxR family transcriptional regulator [Mucilaginibacter pedocola]
MQQNQAQSMSIHAEHLQQQSLQQLNQPEVIEDSVLMVREANHWITEARDAAIPKMLFGKFWHQGEVCILFADSNLGKSILAVQIADAITKGSANAPFDVEAEAQTVVYCDFELTDKQFEARYSQDYTNHYQFMPGFLRAKINPDIELPNGFDDFDQYLIYDLERTVVATNAKVLIIDNLTYLRNETEQANGALPLMKELKNLKNKHGLSILVLAHTPKRDLTQPITRNHLQGSKMLMNFCDSAFAIGESNADSTLRYLKQIKQRNTEQVYGESNVCLCRISKPYNFLHYSFVGFGHEWQQLEDRQKSLTDIELLQQAMQLREEGLTLRQIGTTMGISHQKVDRILKAA